MKLLSGKRVLITGGARGLGRELCLCFARHGASVAFSYNRNTEAAGKLMGELEAAGAPALSFQCSVLDVEGTRQMVSQIEETFGAIDILVNNAGISQNLPLALLEEEDFDRVMDTNVKGTYLTTRAVVRGMMRRKAGVVLNIGSLAGVRMIEAPIHYCASKAAIVGLTEALAKELSRHHVRVLCMAPGLLEDGVGRNLPEHRLTDYLKHCSLGRVGTFTEIAEASAFMVCDLNSYMTGATVLADGGV